MYAIPSGPMCIYYLLLITYLLHLSSSIPFKYECRVGHLFVLSWARVQQDALGSVACCYYCSHFSLVLLPRDSCVPGWSLLVLSTNSLNPCKWGGGRQIFQLVVHQPASPSI